MEYEVDLMSGSIIKRSINSTASGLPVENVQVLTLDGLSLADSPTEATGVQSWTDHNAARRMRSAGG
jgi:hypothetical protein